MTNSILVVRMKGIVDVPYWARKTLDLLNLDRKFRATIIPAKDNTTGMLNKVKHYVAWKEIDEETTKEILEKKGRKGGYSKITQEDVANLGFSDIDQLAKSIAEGQVTLSNLKPLKPWFALSPPRHGFRKNTKRLAGQKGILGKNDTLLELVRRMM